MNESAKKCLMLAFDVAVYSIGYLSILHFLGGRGVFHEVALPLDFKIPFIKYFGPFYLLVYVWPAIVFALCWKSYAVIKGGFKAYLASALFCMACFVLFPVKFHLRATLFAPYDLFENMMRFSYWIDGPAYNCFPSLHVSSAFIGAQMVDRYDPKLSKIFYFFAVMITLSTLFVRQHYLVDVLAGMVVAYFCGMFLPKRIPIRPLIQEIA